MNQSLEHPQRRSRADIDAEIQRMMHEQGIEPFNFDEAVKDMSEAWTDEDERSFEEFIELRRRERKAEREAREWPS